MSFFGLITRDWWAVLLAYIGTLGPLALAAWLFAPDAIALIRASFKSSDEKAEAEQ